VTVVPDSDGSIATASPPLVVVAGATATGKTELAIRLAEALVAAGRPAAVISADSRQVFRGLDIGTAKVGAADRARARHFGLDLVDADQPFTVVDFVTHARTVLADLAREGAVAILAGGTGLYLRAVARGLDTDALPNDTDLRARLEAELATEGLPASVERLGRLAPVLAAGVDTRNPRRVVRALEIAELRGDGPRPAARGYRGPVCWLGLTVQPGIHAARIAARAGTQFDDGLIEEARALRERFDPGLPAFSAIGYREAWAVLDGELTRSAAIALDAQRNIAFAKRQRTWFRSEADIDWLDATEALPTAAALAHIRHLVEP
jgi:tRNA dimethylallyltransferase